MAAQYRPRKRATIGIGASFAYALWAARFYLGLDVMTAVKEAKQGFAYKIDSSVLYSCRVVWDDIANHWAAQTRVKESTPPPGEVVRRLCSQGYIITIVSDLTVEATLDGHNLVLSPSDEMSHCQVRVFGQSE